MKYKQLSFFDARLANSPNEAIAPRECLHSNAEINLDGAQCPDCAKFFAEGTNSYRAILKQINSR